MDQAERIDGERAQHPAVCNETLRLLTRGNLTHDEYVNSDIESSVRQPSWLLMRHTITMTYANGVV
jgi:hypothetical protein